jgi:hypothetical protein
MSDLRAAAEQALDTLEHVQAHIGRYDPPVVTTIARAMQPTIDALRAALSAEQPQPVCPHIRSSGVGDHATHWCALAEQPQPEAVAWPKVNGTARMFDNARALMVIMEREPTDDEMRAFDDAIKGWAAPPPAAPQPEAQPVAVVTECEACFTPDVCQLRGKCDHYSTDWLRVAPPPSAPCPHIRSSGVGDHATHWCALNGPPSAPEPSRTLTQDERDVFDAAERRSTKVVVPEPSEAQVEAAWRAIPASHEDSRVSVITKGDVWVMLRAAAAARNTNPA